MNHEHEEIERIEDAATLWVARIDVGLTAQEQDEYLEWLAADPRHGAEYARARENWQRLDRLADWRPQFAPQPNCDVLAPAAAAPRPWYRRRLVAWTLPLAAAAVVALGVSFFLARERSPEEVSATRIAAIEQRTLPDGSQLELNRGAVVSVLYTPTERRVRLEQGEVNFTVAKNPARPFIVSAGGVDVRAVGTVFNVHLKANAVEVLVTEGKVQVQPPEGVTRSGVAVTPEQTLVAAGERAIVPIALVAPAPQVAAVTPEQVDHLLAWQPKWLDFDGDPLSRIVAEFNRRNAPIRLEIADPALAQTVVSASLRSDNIENLIRLLEGGFGVKAEREGDVITLRRK